MTKPAPFTQASVRRAIKAAESAGLRVTGIMADGTVLTTRHEPDAGEHLDLDPFVLGAQRVQNNS